MIRTYITIDEAEALFGKSRAFIEYLIDNGEIVYLKKKNKEEKVHIDSFISFLKSHQNKSEVEMIAEIKYEKICRAEKHGLYSASSIHQGESLNEYEDKDFYADIKEYVNNFGGIAKDAAKKLIEILVEDSLAVVIMQDFLDCGMDLGKLKFHESIPCPQIKNILYAGFNRFMRRLVHYEELLNRVNIQEEKIKELTDSCVNYSVQLKKAESEGYINNDIVSQDVSLNEREETMLASKEDVVLSVQNRHSLENVGLSNRVKHRLKDLGIVYLEELQAHTPRRLISIRGFGEGCLNEVILAMKKYGLEFGQYKDDHVDSHDSFNSESDMSHTSRQERSLVSRPELNKDNDTKSEHTQENNSIEWKKCSPAYNLVKTSLKENKSYDEILAEIDVLYQKDPVGYSTRTGSKITKPILSNWAKELGYHCYGAKRIKKAWMNDSVAFQWFKEQLLSGKSQDEIIIKFNELHTVHPEIYSTKMGSMMTIETFKRWKSAILEFQEESVDQK